MSKSKNIHPVFDKLLSRKEREKKLQQYSKVIWLIGLSGSGKSTIARALEYELYLRNYKCMVLDGDNVRTGINNNLNFSEEDRKENIRRVAETAKLFLDAGVISICSFITPLEAYRTQIESIIGKEDLIQIFIDAPIEECEKRDVKGLYAKARRGEIKDFTGVNAPFEVPQNAALSVSTKDKTIYDSFSEVLKFILPQLRHQDHSITQYENYNI
jgi:adenylylsulfate kinase